MLSDINLVAKAGQTIGIMGPTGCGKSTLISLIPRFMDVSRGAILIDGVDVRKYDLNTLRGIVGMSMQDVFLFSETIDANISYGDPEMPEERVIECAKDADADGFIRRTPEGYETIIGERGVGLSGGQKQRIALARALAYDTPILILDDTTSAVDMDTEAYIQERLHAREKKATTLIVAQRISSVKEADCIISWKTDAFPNTARMRNCLRSAAIITAFTACKTASPRKGVPADGRQEKTQ